MGMTIVLIEHDRGQLKRPSLHAISAALKLGQPFALLAVGHSINALGEQLARFGAESVLLADDPALEHPLAERYAKVVADIARSRGASGIVASSSTFIKDILPRAAALLDSPMLSDVMAIERVDGELHFRRPINAGNLIATVRLDSLLKIMSIRATAFEAPEEMSRPCPVHAIAVDAASLANSMQFISREQRDSHRPDLAEARVVVAGGRPLKDKHTFDTLIGGLADALGGAVASTRAAVDSGIAANDTQVGQTGKVVAPQLYLGIGISGAIQHMAGVSDSRIIVAINKDPEAPIFQFATYGLVGDLHQIVPQLIQSIGKVPRMGHG